MANDVQLDGRAVPRPGIGNIIQFQKQQVTEALVFDKITIHTISPNGWPLDFEFIPKEKGDLDAALSKLEGWGFSPAPTAEAARDFRYTPEGLPICPKHGEVMTKREKQGDTWHSHSVTDSTGQKHYCRGYASKNSPGWHID